MKPETKNELKDSYHDLLNRVHFLIDEGVESLEEAIRAAMSELNLLGRHSEEELRSLSAELQDDVKLISTETQELGHEIQQLAAYEKGYLTEELKGLLFSIADKTTLDRLQLEETLAQQRHKNKSGK